jgi:TetR/AcrR family transcriptional regulator
LNATASPVPSHQRRKAERPQELIDAALRLFVEKGFAATKAEDIARQAGVSKGTLYLYYTSKEDLLREVISQRVSSRIAEGAQIAAGHQGSSAELMRTLLTDWWSQTLESDASAVFKLVISEVRNFPELAGHWQREVIEPGSQLIGGMVQRGIERGEFRPVDVASVVHSIVLPMVMLCVHRHSLGACDCPAQAIDPHLFIRQHIELVLRGLLIHPDAADAGGPASSPRLP